MKIKFILANLFLTSILLFSSNVFADMESDINAIKQSLRGNMNDLTTNIRNSTRSIDTSTNNIESSIQEIEGALENGGNGPNSVRKEDVDKGNGRNIYDYMYYICKYLEEIWNFIRSPQNEDTDFHPEVRYVKFKEINDSAKEQAEILTKKLNNLVLYGKYQEKVDPGEISEDIDILNRQQAYDRPLHYSSGEGESKIQYSTLSAETLYGEDVYDTEKRQEAAEDFVKNVVGNLSFPSAELKNRNNEKILKYNSYQRTMTAIQSIVAKNLIDEFVSRQPIEVDLGVLREGGGSKKITTSKLKFLKDMNTEDPSQEHYWLDDNPGNLGIIQRAFVFFDSFFALNYSLNELSEQLRKINVQLSLMLVQNAFLSKAFYGDQLYEEMHRSLKKSVRYPPSL